MRRSALAFLAGLLLVTGAAAWADLEHPAFPALDGDGNALLDWDERVSETRSCGACHDSDYIRRSLGIAHRLPAERLSTAEVEQARLLGPSALPDPGDEVSCLACHGTGRPQLRDGLVEGSVILRGSNSGGCADCHGAVVLHSSPPFAHDGQRRSADLGYRSGALTVAQRVNGSGMNIAGKGALSDPFDVHLARGLVCSDCHRSGNRPGDAVLPPGGELPHLRNDPRSVALGDYLYRPDHGFTQARQCQDCHRAGEHGWLPFRERHMARLDCESCHIPRLYGPALASQHLDSGEIRVRGRDPRGLVTGYTPLLLPVGDRLSPHNLIATWYRHDEELRGRLQAVPVRHGVVRDGALRDCAACHHPGGRAQASLDIGAAPPGSERISLPAELDGAARLDDMQSAADSSLRITAVPEARGFYLLGADQVSWADRLGMLITLATLAGVLTHGAARYVASRRRAPHDEPRQRLYLYSVYERLWHWLQAAAILVLLVTGAAIHKPYLFGWLSFPYMVHLHNTVGFVLLGNAFLAAFYHFASGEVKQYLPGRADLFARMFTQAAYYTGGIFRGEPHPFTRDADHKLNPLQQITYLGLLNTLLPAQILTGLLIWGAQRWPGISEAIGGLYVLGPLHSFMAWLFAAFLIMHIYLTTTAGPKPLSAIRGMLDGWDDVESTGGST